MIRKSRLIAALGMVLALVVSSLAFATGADDNTPFVDGEVKPSKLDKKKFKKVSLFLGVRNEGTITGTQSNPSREYISIGKNVKVNLKKAEVCTTPIPNGTPTAQARQSCPADSLIGEGEAAVESPAGQTFDLVVSVFNGPGPGELRLHTYSEELAGASPVVPAKVVKSNAGPKFGQALDVPVAPETGALKITKFNATIGKATGVVTARCKAKQIDFLREVTYKDGSKETAELTQKCKRKKSRR